MKRTDKLALLSQVLAGQTSELKQFRTQRGVPYTPQQQAEQQAYLTALTGKPATEAEVVGFFGRYDQSHVPGATAYELPNKMLLFF